MWWNFTKILCVPNQSWNKLSGVDPSVWISLVHSLFILLHRRKYALSVILTREYSVCLAPEFADKVDDNNNMYVCVSSLLRRAVHSIIISLLHRIETINLLICSTYSNSKGKQCSTLFFLAVTLHHLRSWSTSSQPALANLDFTCFWSICFLSKQSVKMH